MAKVAGLGGRFTSGWKKEEEEVEAEAWVEPEAEWGGRFEVE